MTQNEINEQLEYYKNLGVYDNDQIDSHAEDK